MGRRYYLVKPKPDYQKLRGGYYTPPEVARFLATWAVRSDTDRVLEPSAGDGSILVEAASRLLSLGAQPAAVAQQIHAIELDPQEAEKANARVATLGIDAEAKIVRNGDFFGHAQEHLLPLLGGLMDVGGEKFEAVIGNPPFVRYQNFPEEHRQIAFALMNKRGFVPNRLTNAWLPFLVLSAHLVADAGRLAMVIPAELFQVKYASEARQFLSDYFESLTLITFRSLLFTGVQQEVILLLGEKQSSSAHGIRTIEFDNASELQAFDPREVERVPVKPLDHSSEKWTKYFLHSDEIALLRKTRVMPGVTPSGEVLDVNVGVVTGNNRFFLLSQEQVVARSLTKHVTPIVSRSNHLAGLRFTGEDWSAIRHKELPSMLFTPPDIKAQESVVQDYIAEGEAGNHHLGFKCRVRKRWFIVPSLAVPQAFMLRQVHGYPKLVLNESGATCTDTIHRVDFLNGYSGEVVVAAFLNSLTFAHAEVRGRSYGGGVLTFEPSEAEELPLPLRYAERLDIQLIDRLLRLGEIEEILDITDHVLLVQGLGLSTEETESLRSMWRKLRNRRANRR